MNKGGFSGNRLLGMTPILSAIAIMILTTFTLSGCSPSATQAAPSSSISPSPQMEYYFTQAQQHPEQALESQINSTKSTLDIAIYSLTKKDIVDAIIAAKKRGANVRIITDRIEAKSKSEEAQLKLLKGVNIPIKENSHSGLMHMKVSIIDKSVVTTGSYNYTQNASTENDEVLVVIHDPGIASKWEDEFQLMWDDKKDYVNLN
ncbi:MAG: phospholipase D family protein [Desulfosporosinus sp.]|nr:phospholipase D family protein [Desulfosporosinus sp.]